MYIFMKSTHFRLCEIWGAGSRQCCWRYKPCGIVHRGNWYIGTGACKEHSAISFRVKKSKKSALPLDCLGLNMKEVWCSALSLFTSWHSVTSQNTWISACTSILSCIGLYLGMWYNMAAAVSTVMCGAVGVRHSTSVATIMEWGVSA